MDSADSSEDSRESLETSPENRPLQETHFSKSMSLDAPSWAESKGLQELGFEMPLVNDPWNGFLGKKTANQRDADEGDDSDDGDFLSAAAERRGISGGVVKSPAESREEFQRRFNVYVRYQEDRRETAKRFASYLHSGMAEETEDHKDHKKQKIGEDGAKKVEELGGPFRDALEAINMRSSNLDPDATRLMLCAGENNGFNLRTRVVPSLLELCLRQIGKYSEALVSLKYIPDGLKSKIATAVCALGELNARFMKLLVKDSPTEICVKNCSNLVEQDLIAILRDCDTETLRVLELDFCGHSMTEHVICDLLSCSPRGFPALTNLCLKGAFTLTGRTLSFIVRSAPLLERVNLSDCSLLTEYAIKVLLDNFGSTLKDLNIDNCLGIIPSKILGNLKKFVSLSSLSIAGLEGVDDGFVLGFLEARGSNLTSLVLASCTKVTDESTKAIGRHCPKLRVLDISFLDKLTDTSLQYIANGCRSLRKFKCCRNDFSDKCVAAFLEVSGGLLNALSLNNIGKVSLDTVISLSKVSKKLHSLDLSWCRNLNDEDLSIILRSCPSLRELKLFGCSQVTEEFLEQTLCSPVRIIGLRECPSLKHLNDFEPVFQEASDSE